MYSSQLRPACSFSLTSNPPDRSHHPTHTSTHRIFVPGFITVGFITDAPL
jgi:hypothetical protein